jgi:glucose-6-phosphate-specific signal transduction histidine kinase
MRKDPIVEEMHAIRRALARECHDDISEIITHLQKRSRDAGRKTVTLRPKPVAKPAARTRPRRRRTA